MATQNTLKNLKKQYAEISTGYTIRRLNANQALNQLSTVRGTLFAITNNHETPVEKALAATQQLQETEKLFSEVSAAANQKNDCTFTI